MQIADRILADLGRGFASVFEDPRDPFKQISFLLVYHRGWAP